MATRWTEAEYRAYIERGLAGEVTAEQYAPRPRVHRESNLQRHGCQFWQMRYPETWEHTWHTPNGLAAKSRTIAAIFRGLGVKPGIPDLICVHTLNYWRGCVIEVKDEGRPATELQLWWLRHFESQGYLARVTDTFEGIVRVLRQFHGH